MKPGNDLGRAGLFLFAGCVSCRSRRGERHMGRYHPSPTGRPAQAAWNPIERVDLATMIAMYTINAAYGDIKSTERDRSRSGSWPM